MPLISIIVPVYNVEKYLTRCLESIINQTYKTLQIILVDDGSTDRSGLLCDQYAQRDNRIEVIHKKNGGLSDARNAGLDCARGEFIGFVDSDDYIIVDMYEALYDAMQRYDADVACCGRIDIFEAGEARYTKRFLLSKEQYFGQKEAIRELCTAKTMDFASWDKLYRAKLYDGLRFPKHKVSEDIPVIYEIFKNSTGIVHIGRAKYCYCHRDDSITGKGFYPRRMDTLIFTQNVYQNMQITFPDLIKEREILYYRAVAGMWRNVKKSGRYKKIERKLRRRILRFWFSFMSNPYTGSEERKKICRELVTAIING